ncbi:conserved hypothetical protein [Ricinus communis]|uniref:Uncharacterized protein n=1 Tax=Ricinus communis TaxID=3988 RepID=B9RHQ0_RICCO|nr:conserved hypothetical protein [Ricinus communis]
MAVVSSRRPRTPVYEAGSLKDFSPSSSHTLPPSQPSSSHLPWPLVHTLHHHLHRCWSHLGLAHARFNGYLRRR